MEQSKYNLMTSGNIKPGFEWKDVEARFAELCKVSPEKARMLVENERVLKKNMDLKNAELYQDKLEGIGVEIRLVELPVDPPAELPSILAMEPSEDEIQSTPQTTALEASQSPFHSDSLALEPLEGETQTSSQVTTEASGTQTSSQVTTEASGTTEGTVVCPKCYLQQPEADQCEGCGVYLHKVRNNSNLHQPLAAEPAAATHDIDMFAGKVNSKALIAAAGAALVGAFAWKIVVMVTGYEFGIMAWLIGGAIGGAAGMAGSSSYGSGVMCGALALAAIIGGKYLVVQSIQMDVLAAMGQSGLQSEDFRPLYEEYVEMARTFKNMSQDEASVRAFLVDYELTNSYEVDQITQEQLNFFHVEIAPELRSLASAPPSFEEWVDNAFGDDFANLSTFDLVIESLGFIDLMFLFFGVATAFRLGSGEDFA